MKTKRTLLLVDDEDNIRRSLIRVLRCDGYTILQADSGAQGLELLQANPAIGVILSDQRMPEMTGIEFLSRARELQSDTVRMVLSGYTDLKTVTDAINQGEIYKFLVKPWEDELLRNNVIDAFEHYELRFENKRLAQELQKINAELEQRVEQKTREILLNVHALTISQEVLEHLPAAVLGIDEDGLVVVANHLAEAVIPKHNNSLIGQQVDTILPDVVCEQIKYSLNNAIPSTIDVTLGESKLHVYCGRMGQTSLAQGVIVVMVSK